MVNSAREEQMISSQTYVSNGYIIVSYETTSCGFLVTIMYSYMFIAGK